MQPLSGNLCPDLLTSLMNMSLVLRLPRVFTDPLQMSHACHRFWKCYKTFTFWSFARGCHAKRHLNAQKCSVPVSFLHFWACTFSYFSTSQLPKVLPEWRVLHILTSKCASTCQLPKVLRHWGVLYILSFAPQRRALFRHRNLQKCSEREVCVHFDIEMCFAPQWRALFGHCNFQVFRMWGVCVCVYILALLASKRIRNVLLATTACNFSSHIWPDGSAPAALASLLFDPPEPQIIGKTQCFATFLPFRAPASSFFSLFLFSSLVSSSLLLSDSSRLCFSICPYCRKFDF